MRQIEKDYMKGRLLHGWPPLPEGHRLKCRGADLDDRNNFVGWLFDPPHVAVWEESIWTVGNTAFLAEKIPNDDTYTTSS